MDELKGEIVALRLHNADDVEVQVYRRPALSGSPIGFFRSDERLFRVRIPRHAHKDEVEALVSDKVKGGVTVAQVMAQIYG